MPYTSAQNGKVERFYHVRIADLTRDSLVDDTSKATTWNILVETLTMVVLALRNYTQRLDF